MAVIYEHGDHGGMILTEDNSCLIHQSSLAVLPAESSSSKQEEWAKEIMNLNLGIILFILPK
jgi:hypothetical protein